jgi:hypothetical protein
MGDGEAGLGGVGAADAVVGVPDVVDGAAIHVESSPQASAPGRRAAVTDEAHAAVESTRAIAAAPSTGLVAFLTIGRIHPIRPQVPPLRRTRR